MHKTHNNSNYSTKCKEKNMKKLLALIAALTLTFVGCSSGDTGADTGSTGTDSGTTSGTTDAGTTDAGTTSDLKVALVAAGVFGDQGMNDALLNGMNMFTEATGIEVTSVEVAEFADHAINATNFAEQGYDLIIMGGPVSEIMPDIANQYPDTHFILNKGTIADLPNVTSVQFDEAQPSFLGGVFAVLMSEHLGGERSAGWVGGMRIPDLEKARFSYVAGAEYVDGNVDVIYVGDFTDIAKGKEIALQMYNNGAKIVQGYAGGASTGVYQAAESLDDTHYAMGSATGQFNLSPKIMASVIVKYDESLNLLMQQYVNDGSIDSGIMVLNLGTEGSDLKYAPDHEANIPQEIKDEIAKLKEMIINGEIVPPTTEEEYNEFSA